jgi:hypothetical protein
VKDLREMELPRLITSRTDKELAKCVIPKTEMDEPILKKERQDNPLPKET